MSSSSARSSRWRAATWIGSSRNTRRSRFGSTLGRRRRPAPARHVRSVSPDDVGFSWARSWSQE